MRQGSEGPKSRWSWDCVRSAAEEGFEGRQTVAESPAGTRAENLSHPGFRRGAPVLAFTPPLLRRRARCLERSTPASLKSAPLKLSALVKPARSQAST